MRESACFSSSRLPFCAFSPTWRAVSSRSSSLSILASRRSTSDKYVATMSRQLRPRWLTQSTIRCSVPPKLSISDAGRSLAPRDLPSSRILWSRNQWSRFRGTYLPVSGLNPGTASQFCDLVTIASSNPTPPNSRLRIEQVAHSFVNLAVVVCEVVPPPSDQSRVVAVGRTGGANDPLPDECGLGTGVSAEQLGHAGLERARATLAGQRGGVFARGPPSRGSEGAPRQNIVFGLAEFVGTICRTSQCSTILPLSSKRNMSIPA